MKYLFVHQNFPGQFLHLVRHLLAQKLHDVVFICEANQNSIPGVRRVNYRVPPRDRDTTHAHGRDFDKAMIRAEAVAKAAATVKAMGFEPDIIIGHHGWGELLNLSDVWPGAPLLGYHEFYYHVHGVDVGFDPEFPVSDWGLANVRAKNAVNLLALTNPGHGQTPTLFQLNTYPDWARPSIDVLAEGVNLKLCQPKPVLGNTEIAGIPVAAKEKLVTYVARDLEPYRGFHVMMRALPALMRARSDTRVIMVGGDGVSYGAQIANTTWREHMQREVGAGVDWDRVHFPGRVAYEQYIQLLQRSDAHVYLTYPFVASWSLREAMACGCAVIASDTEPVREFITHGRTGQLTPFFDPGALSDVIATTLDGGARIERMRRAARAWAEKHLGMDDYITAYEALIARLTGRPAAASAPRGRVAAASSR